jgi:hypothetical protein
MQPKNKWLTDTTSTVNQEVGARTSYADNDIQDHLMKTLPNPFNDPVA